jgi:exonuclease SbcC
VFDQLKIKQQRCFNEIASKSAIITNELSRLKVVSFSQYEYIAIVEIRDENKITSRKQLDSIGT